MKKTILYIIGAAFVLIGIIGFFNDPVLGIFEVDTLHNYVHMISGILALYCATREDLTELYGKIMAVVYGLVTVLGFVLADGNIFGLMTVNPADNYLHVVFTLVFLYVGFAPSTSMSKA